MTQSFFEWTSPENLIRKVGQEEERLGDQWRARAGREFREAFIAGRFGKFRNASRVRLISPGNAPTPDFAIELGNDEFWYETTEVDRPGRRRGAEPPLPAPESVPDDEWASSAEYKAVVIARSAKKASKCYAKCDGLIIYDNAFPITDREMMTLDWWREATQTARECFTEIWVFQEGKFNLIT